jgi:hypothetical protein
MSSTPTMSASFGQEGVQRTHLYCVSFYDASFIDVSIFDVYDASSIDVSSTVKPDPLVSYDYDCVYIFRHEGVQRTAFPGHLVCILGVFAIYVVFRQEGVQRIQPLASNGQIPRHDPERSLEHDPDRSEQDRSFSLSLFFLRTFTLAHSRPIY